MTRINVDEVRRVLPELEELRPLVEAMITTSEPDPAREWAGSGEIDTVGGRLVQPQAVAAASASLAAREHDHIARTFDAVARSVDCLTRQDQSGAAAALLEAAALEESRERPSRAAAYAAAAYRAVRTSTDQAMTALAIRRWARASRAMGELAEAESLYARSYETALALSEWLAAAEAALGAGNVLEEQGRWVEAEEWYRLALARCDDSGEKSSERWQALVNIHIAMRFRGQVDESRVWLKRAEDAAREIHDPSAAVFLENARGQLEMASGHHRAGELHLRAALEVASGLRAQVTVRLNLSEALLAQGRTLEAAQEARVAERDALRTGLMVKLPETYRLLGRIALASGNSHAFVLFERALALVKEYKLPAIEEAMTLRAYAEEQLKTGQKIAAQELNSQATDIYRRLGIVHERAEWADVFVTERVAQVTQNPTIGMIDE